MDIVAFGYRPWTLADTQGVCVRDMHFIANLAKCSDVGTILHVSRPVSLAEQIIRRIPTKLRNGTLVLSGPGYRLYHVPEYGEFYSLIIRSRAVIGPLTKRRTWWDDAIRTPKARQAISAAYDYLALVAPVLLNWSPFAPSAEDVAPHSLYAFDVIDNFSNHARITNDTEVDFCREAYARIGRSADVITSVSSKALEVFLPRVHGMTVIPNGVDRSWLDLSPAVPDDLAALKARGPVVGTGGFLFDKFRIDLLCDLAKRMPDITFVLIGRLQTSEIRRRVAKEPNIVYLGFKSIDQVPSYYANFDVGFIFYDMDMENDGDPLKLYELLALGTPVVSLPSMGIKQLDGVVEVINTAAEGEDRIRSLLAVAGEDQIKFVRSQLSVCDFWQEKARRLAKILRDGLAAKSTAKRKG